MNERNETRSRDNRRHESRVNMSKMEQEIARGMKDKAVATDK